MPISEEILTLLEKGEAVVIRLETFVDLQKRVERLLCASAASVILHEAGRECGKRSIQRIAMEKALSGDALLKELSRYKKEEKWGEFDFNEVNLEEASGVIRIKESFEAKRYGASIGPVCHFLRGYLAGVLAVIFGQDMSLEETKCKAKGDGYCEFQIRSLL